MTFHAMDDDDFLLPPLPNHLFTRDNSAWIYDGVAINPMRKAGPQRESVHFEAIYRFHPLFADAGFARLVRQDAAGTARHHRGRRRPRHRRRRGADRDGRAHHAAGASSMLARGLFAAGAATRIVALDCPRRGRSCTSTP